MEPVDVPHHVIPGPPPAPHTPTTHTAGAGGAAGGGAGIAHHLGQAAIAAIHAGGGLFTLLGIVGVALAVAGAAVFMLRLTRPSRLSSPRTSGSGGGLTGLPYVYRGLRAVLRGIFLELRARASRVTGRSLEWATPRELAALLGSPAARGFARGYEESMYGPGEPRPGDVEELRRLAEEAGGFVED